MIHVYYGEGKGKTTAALGLIVRHVGGGGRAVFAQFLKSAPTGELAALQRLGVPVLRNDFAHGFSPAMNAETRAAVTRSHNEILAKVTQLARSGSCTLLVLDELCAALSLGLVDRDAVCALLDEHGAAELVVTGRDPSKELLGRADYATEMRLIKHPYENGVKARKGIEF